MSKNNFLYYLLIFIVIPVISICILFYYQLFFWIFFHTNRTLSKEDILYQNFSNYIYNYSLFEKIDYNYQINKNYVRIVSDNDTYYLEELKYFLINIEKIKNVEVYNII